MQASKLKRRWCPNLLVRVYIAVICALLACEGSRYVNGGLDRASFGPVVHPKEIFIVNGRIYDEEYSKVLEVLQLRLHQKFILSGTSRRSSRHCDWGVDGVIRKEQAGSEASMGKCIIKPCRLTVFHALYYHITPYDPSGCFAIVNYVHRRRDWLADRQIVQREIEFQPRALVFAHNAELAPQNNELIDRGRSQDQSEKSHPYGSFSSNMRRPVCGGLLLLLGCAFVFFGFYIVDEPSPPMLFRLLSLGSYIAAFVCIFQGLGLIFGISVTQKYRLTTPNYCNTIIAIGRQAMANVLSTDKQIAVISALAEGSSIRSIERITGVHRDTIMRLGVRVGQGCARVLDVEMRNLSCQQLQFDEIWGFIGKKERHCTPDDSLELGDVWTFCAIDPETKLVPSFKCGKRDLPTANAFVADVASRMRNRVQISSDALRAYVEAVEMNFGADVDFAQIIKTYITDDSHIPERRFSAPEIVVTEKKSVSGFPDLRLASTSHVERLNGTTRLHMRRLTRLTYAFSKKLENFQAAVALHFAYYNFVKRHNTLRTSPAMAAGIARDFWTVGHLIEAAA